MIHIITINWTTDKWIDIQLDSFKKHIKQPYRVYTRLGNMDLDTYGKHKNKYDVCIQGNVGEKAHLTTGIKETIPEVKKILQPEDSIILIDSDAFLIGDISSLFDRLKNYPLVAAQELNHDYTFDEKGKNPHPMFYLFKGNLLLTDPELEYVLTRIILSPNSNWWGGVEAWLSKREYVYSPIIRSNGINLHPLYFAIYEDMIYHHWAGSRNMITRPDRHNHKTTGKSLEEIAGENHDLSNMVYDQIFNQQETFISYLKGNYKGELE